MNITSGQHKDIERVFPGYDRKKSHIVVEAGNDDGTTFRGDFVVRIFRKGAFRFSDGKMVRRLP